MLSIYDLRIGSNVGQVSLKMSYAELFQSFSEIVRDLLAYTFEFKREPFERAVSASKGDK